VGNDTAYSSDGSNWTAISTIFSSNGNRVAWNGGMWVAVGDGGTALSNIQHSYDGSNWTASASSSFDSYGFGITWDGSLWVAAGYDTTASNRNIKYSSDGSNWSNSTGYAFSNLALDVAARRVLPYVGTTPIGGGGGGGGTQGPQGPQGSGSGGGAALAYVPIDSGTTITPGSNSYNTWYDIQASTITDLSIGYPADGYWGTDTPNFWLFRNNSGTYLTIAVTYTNTAANVYPTTFDIPSGSSVILMATYYGGGSNSNYVLF
jgi:hypothetical protein